MQRPTEAASDSRATSGGPDDDPDGIDALVGSLLTASRVLVGVAAISLADVENSVTVTQFRTLVVLDGHGPVNLNRLAELLDVTTSTAVRMIDRLLVAGLVDRRDNPANRREIVLQLTASGRRIVRKVTARRHRDIATIVRRMSGDQRTAMVAALHAFADAAGEPAAEISSFGW